MIEEKEYCDVFAKDSRNRRAIGAGNKRNNKKEVNKRLAKMLEKEEQTENDKPCIEEETDEEESAKTKKYINGKPKRSEKKQTHYFEELLLE